MNGRRGSVRYEKRIYAPADDVWELVGDPARLCEWFPGIVSSAVDGDERVVTTATGLPIPERLLTVDPLLRRFQYRIDAPMFHEHLGTIDVFDLGDGTSLVAYSTDADPATLALLIGGGTAGALDELRTIMESRN